MKNWFPHDYNARNDPKLINLEMILGKEAKGIYWDLVEMMYEQGGYLNLNEVDSYAFELRTEKEKILSVFGSQGLFRVKKNLIFSESVLRRLERRNRVKESAKESARKRWDVCERNTNAMRTHKEKNANAMLEEKRREENIYRREKEKEKEKVNPSNTRVFLNYEELKSEMLASGTWIEQTAMHLQTDNDFIRARLEYFLTEIWLKEDIYKPLSEIKAHFINWFKTAPQPKEQPGTKQPEKEKYPDYWDEKFYDQVCMDYEAYEAHLKQLGFEPKFNPKRKRIEFIKNNS